MAPRPEAQRRTFGGRNPAILISVCLIFFALCASSLYFLFRSVVHGKAVSRPPVSHQEVPVVHGRPATPEDLAPRGRLFFVPVGRQAISVQTLAEYYQQKFNFRVEILPEMPLPQRAYNPVRHQYVAEEILGQMWLSYPELARDPDAVIIALTDEDIFRQAFAGDSFTYSLHGGYHLGVVSTRRMDPAFWGDPPNEAVRLASTRQMLTKYIALMYFHVPLSYDPTSVMHQPLTPDGGADDLYESDLHSEESVNGLEGSGWPCISYVYSYSTRELAPVSDIPTDCELTPKPASPDQEVFRIELGMGRFVLHAMDAEIESNPPIEYSRSYISADSIHRALGVGADTSFNRSLVSDGAAFLSYIEIVREDGWREHLDRRSPGRGFSPSVVFEGTDPSKGSYGALMTWDQGQFKLAYRDGSVSTFLPCGDYRCFWSGYQDATGHRLVFDRTPERELLRVSSSDNQEIRFEPDAEHRIANAVTSSGDAISYKYDSSGCLTSVKHGNGRTTLYEYDAGHHMTGILVSDAGRKETHRILTNEYDAQGHLIRQSLSSGAEYVIDYDAFVGGHASRLTIKAPSGRVLHLAIGSDGYRMWAVPSRFPAVSNQR